MTNYRLNLLMHITLGFIATATANVCKAINQVKHHLLVMYCTRCTKISVSCQIQHLASPFVVFATQPHPLYCIFHMITCNSALTYPCITYMYDTYIFG